VTYLRYLKTDGTGWSIPPAAGGYIVALMTRRGGRRVDGTAWQVTTGQVTCFPHKLMSPRVSVRGDGAVLNAVTEPDDCAHCSIVSGD